MSDRTEDLFSEREADEESVSLRELFARLSSKGGAEADGPRNPFKFLDPYGAGDADRFFGREEETKELFRKLHAAPTLLVYGASGSGKSSLIGCGLASLVPPEDALFVPVRCGAEPVEGLGRGLRRACGELGLPQDGHSPAAAAEALSRASHKTIVLVLDQLEEIYILAARQEREALYGELASILSLGAELRLLFSVREEYLARLTELESLLPSLFDNRFRVERMHANRAAAIVARSCEKGRIAIAPETAASVVAGLSHQGTVELSYLQVYMDKLCRLSLATGAAAPAIDGALVAAAGSFDDVLAAFLEEQLLLTPEPERYRALLKTTVTTEGTKRQQGLADMTASLAATGEAVAEDEAAAMAGRLVDARILRETEDGGAYELRHDALAAKVAEWLTAQEREYLEVEASLRLRLRDRQRRGVLLDGSFLDAVAPYERRLSRNPEYKTLIDQSRRTLERGRRRIRRLAALAAAAALLAIAAVAGVSYGNVLAEKGRADEALATALAEKQRADEALLDVSSEKKRADEALAAVTQEKRRADEALASVTKEKRRADEALAIVTQEKGRADDALVAIYNGEGDKACAEGRYREAAIYAYRSLKTRDTPAGRMIALEALSYLPPPITTVRESTTWIWSVAFSPDGKRIITGSDDDTVKIWASASMRSIGSCVGHESDVVSVSYSPDGAIFASGSKDETVKLWDARTGALIRSLEGCEDDLRAIEFSPEGSLIAAGSDDDTVRVWEVNSGTLVHSLRGHSGNVFDVAFSHDGSLIASASYDHTVKVWDLRSGDLVRTMDHGETVHGVAFSPDGRWIVSGGSDNTVKIWVVSSGRLFRTLKQHTDFVRCVVFSPDGRLLASGSDDKTIALWEASSFQFIGRLSGHDYTINSLAFSPDSRLLVSTAGDGTVRLWQSNSDKFVRNLQWFSIFGSPVFSPDGKRIGVTSLNDIELWDASDGTFLAVLKGHTGRVNTLAYSPDGHQIASGSDDKTIALWDAFSGERLRSLTGNDLEITYLSFFPDGRQIASAQKGKIILVWDSVSGTLERGLDIPISEKSLALSPDGRLFATGFPEKSVRLWDSSSGQLVRTMQGHSAAVYCLAFSLDGKRLVSGSSDTTIRQWEVPSGRLINTMQGHEDYIHHVTFSPDGRQIVSGSQDKKIKVWDASSGSLIRSLHGHTEPVWWVAFSPDNRQFYSGSLDGAGKLWPSSEFIPYEEIVEKLEGFVKYILPEDLDVNGELVPKNQVAFAEAKLRAAEQGRISVYRYKGMGYIEYFRNELARAREAAAARK